MNQMLDCRFAGLQIRVCRPPALRRPVVRPPAVRLLSQDPLAVRTPAVRTFGCQESLGFALEVALEVRWSRPPSQKQRFLKKPECINRKFAPDSLNCRFAGLILNLILMILMLILMILTFNLKKPLKNIEKHPQKYRI